MTFIPGQPVAVGDGFGAFFGDAAQTGRAIIVAEDGSLMNVSMNQVQPLVWWDGQVWLDYAVAYHYKVWSDFNSVSDLARLRAVANDARVCVTKNLAHVVQPA